MISMVYLVAYIVIYLVVCEKQIKNEVKVIEMSCKVKCLPDIGAFGVNHLNFLHAG